MFQVKKAKRQRRPLKIGLEGLSGSGKAQPVDEPVLTPDGFQPIGSLKIGDTVFGRDGLPCKVTGVFPQGVKPVFAVTFSDRTSTRCCDEHLWVCQRANRLKGRWQVLPLKEIRMVMGDYHGRKRARIRVPLAEPVAMPHRDLPISPYVLGCLLGDGCFRGKGVTFATADQSVIDRMCSYDSTLIFTKTSGAYDYYVGGVVGRVKALGLHGTDSESKFIPDAYLFASAEQRLELLQGICDTDGHRNPGYVDVTLKSQRLAEGVALLARSLGYRASLRTRKPPKCERIMAMAARGTSYAEIADAMGSTTASVASTVYDMRKKGRTGSDHPGYFRVNINCDDTNDLVTISRKQGPKRLGKYRPSLQKLIESVEPAGEAECVCIRVDSADHTYLTRDFIVTHNTFTALRMAFAMKRAGIGSRIVVADSENESAGLYDGINIDGEKWEYDVCPLPHAAQHPKGYTDCYEYLVGQGFDIVVMDSMTHAWKGALSKVDELGARNKGDKFGAGWRVVTPEQEQMMRVLTDGRAHLIATTRVKGEYERVEGSNGKDKIKKVGFKADQRDGMEYEYDCVVRLDPDGHHAVVEKVRGCTAMDGRHAGNPGPEFWKPLFDWWLSADAMPVPPTPYEQATADLKAAGAKSCDALKAAWAEVYKAGAAVFGENLYAALELLKDELKAKCQQAATVPTTVSDDEQQARDDYGQRLDHACGLLDITPDQFVTRNRAALKLPLDRPTPRAYELPTAALLYLADLAEATVRSESGK